MKVSDLFVKSLENEGIEYVFGVPGEENEDLLFSLEHSSIQFVATRHEQGAAFMADVWGRLTGKAGVCLATLGPGATNLMTGIADANLDKSPVVAITGQGDLERLHNSSHQNLDIVSMFRPITKWNTSITTADIIPEVIRKAFKVAEFEKPGATHLELPEDVAKENAPEMPMLKARQPSRPGPNNQAIEQTKKLLQEAQRPLIIAGNGSIRKGASGPLTDLVNTFNIPVVSTFMGKGAVSDNNKHSLHTIGLGFKDYVMQAVAEADLILTVGYDIAEYSPEAWNPGNKKAVIHIDFEPAEVYMHYHPEIEIIGDIQTTLVELYKILHENAPSFDREWYKPIRSKIRADIKSYAMQDDDPLTVPGTLHTLRPLLPADSLLISDVGSHKMWIARNYPTYCPNGCIISNGLATMGIALPGAIAASLQNPDRKVVAAAGDGGFMMNIQELETAKRLGVSFIAIVFNDNDYSLISWKQQMHTGRSTGTEISNPSFKALAESFGIKGYAPKTPAELNQQLGQAIEEDELCVIEIGIDSSVNQQLVEKLDAEVGSD